MNKNNERIISIIFLFDNLRTLSFITDNLRTLAFIFREPLLRIYAEQLCRVDLNCS